MRAICVADTLRDERGEGIVSALLLLAGALLPMLFLVSLVGRIEQAELVATQLAQSSVRAATLASSATQAQRAADSQLTAAQAESPAALELTIAGSFVRGGVLESDVTARLPVVSVPLLGEVGSITLAQTARAPIDLYRSLPQAQ